MKTIRVLLIVICVSISLGFSDRGLVLREAYGDFAFLGIQADRVYVFTGEKFHVFNIKDGTPLQTFGQVGQGPGEYTSFFAFPVFLSEGLVINNMGKCILYSLDGTFLKSVQTYMRFDKLLPLGPRFVGRTVNFDPATPDKATTVQVVDDSLKPVRELYRQEKRSRQVRRDGTVHFTMPSAEIDFVTEGGKIYLGDPARDVSISIYDGQGVFIRNIKRNVAKIKIPEEEKKKYVSDRGPNITVADYYPAYHFFVVERGLIYVFTYNFRDDKREVLVLDENNEEIESVWLTRAAPANSCVYQKRFFYVVDDNESGERVLHSEPIF